MPKGKASKPSSDHAYGRLTAYDEQTGAVRAVVEAPRACENKYKLDEESGLFYLHKVLPEGMSFPLDFGYVPGTLADDGDPIDVLIFSDHPTITGAIARVRLIGVIMAEQRSVVEPEWKKNHRLLGVAVVSHSHHAIRRIEDLEPGTVDDLENFFIAYNKAQGKQFNVLGRGGVEVAHQLLRDAIEARAAKNAQLEEEEALGPNVIPLRAGVFRAKVASVKTKKSAGGAKPKAKPKKAAGGVKLKAKPKKAAGGVKPKAKPKKAAGGAKLKAKPKKAAGGAKLKAKPKKAAGGAKPKAKPKKAAGDAKPRAKAKKSAGGAKPRAKAKKSAGGARPKAKAKAKAKKPIGKKLSPRAKKAVSRKPTKTKKAATTKRATAKKVTKKKKATNAGAIKRAKKASST